MERLINQTLATAAAAFTLLCATATSAQIAPAASAVLVQPADIIRGPLPSALLRLDTGKAASCPNSFRGALENGKFICSKTVRQFSNIKCPSRWPNYVVRNVPANSFISDRDLCVKQGIVVTSNGSLDGLVNGTDFVVVPVIGIRNRDSFVEADPDATVTSGWRLDVNGPSGSTDRYARNKTFFADPILVAR